jgi:pyruvate formate lyase activating enzyme
MKGIVFNIQRYSIHDGPGIRTDVFMKGCPLSCKWCSNPEGIRAKRELGVYPSKCLGVNVCGSCLKACPLGGAPLLFNKETGKIGAVDRNLCRGCLRCTEECYLHALKSWGDLYTVDEVVKEVSADKNFYDNSGGGITLNGGEVTVQWEFALAILEACRKEYIHTCVETCMHCAPEVIERFFPLTDLMITDIKHMDSDTHKYWTGAGNERLLSNIEKTARAGMPMIIRVPVIPQVNDSEDNIRATAKFIRDTLHNRVIQVQLLTYLKMGTEKYDSLGMPYPMGEDYVPATREEREPWIAHLVRVMREYDIKAVAGASTNAE